MLKAYEKQKAEHGNGPKWLLVESIAMPSIRVPTAWLLTSTLHQHHPSFVEHVALWATVADSLRVPPLQLSLRAPWTRTCLQYAGKLHD
eukprot:6468311-Amphidinium_carterae.1